MSLLVIGSVAYDAIETPFGKTDKIVGGSATYISLSASYLTNSANLVAVVGYDFEKAHIQMLQEHGVNTEGLQIKADEKSFFWAGKYHADLNNRDTLVTELNVLGTFDPIIPESYQDCSYLMLGNLSPQVQMQVIERLRNRPKLVVMDTMNLWINIAREELVATLSKVDVVSVNDEEARMFTGQHSLVKAAKDILKMGPKAVIIKKGEHGALLFREGEVFAAPALPLEEVFDPTGAGDSFAGGFIGFLASRNATDFESMKSALIHGSAMASFCVEKFGPERLLNLEKGEINSRIKEFEKLARYETYSI